MRARNDIAAVGVAAATTPSRVGQGQRQATTLILTFTAAGGLPAEKRYALTLTTP